MNTKFPRTTYERAVRDLLDEALELGIRVGVAPEGSEIILVAPLKVPYETRRWFEKKIDEFRAEVIDIIQRENAARAGVRP
jgi:hypothetical protein